ncbi:hypothetical protein AS4_18520 [Acinetobacter guillouiae]|nr:hypothetical protein AS4_18520 [Acinetobacter guillouiae]
MLSMPLLVKKSKGFLSSSCSTPEFEVMNNTFLVIFLLQQYGIFQANKKHDRRCTSSSLLLLNVLGHSVKACYISIFMLF